MPMLIAEVQAQTGQAGLDLSGLQTALTSAITPQQLLTVLASIIGVGMGFVLMWFGVRKLIKIFSNAFQKGKISA